MHSFLSLFLCLHLLLASALFPPVQTLSSRILFTETQEASDENSASASLEAQATEHAAGISVVRRWVAMEVPCTYAQFESMRREVTSFDGVVERVDYGADVLLSALLPEEKAQTFAARVLDVTAGAVEVLEAGEQLKDVPWQEPLGKDSETP